MAAPLPAQLSTVYDNSSFDTFITYAFSAVNATRIGDVAQLEGMNRLLSNLSIQLYNFSGSSGFFDAQLELYNYDGSIGPLIGNASVSGVGINGNGTQTVTFTDLDLVVPDQFAFVIGISSIVGAIDVGLNIFGPPTIGSSDDAHLLVDYGSGIQDGTTAQGEGNLYMVANALPVSEPSTALLIVFGLASLTCAAQRRAA
ncbi:MAG: hypothetical protein IBJ03_02145 [Gemmatimonadaceae bacterium]|nr:hypothetical protein [Gemmatimonadaceae bacterium]